MKKKKIAVLSLAVGLLAFSGIVEAGTEYRGYNRTVGKINGSAYTPYQTKEKDLTFANLESHSVGGSYTVDARTLSTSYSGGWYRGITDGDYRNMINYIKAGNTTRIQFSNDVTTPVDVRVRGNWRSN